MYLVYSSVVQLTFSNAYNLFVDCQGSGLSGNMCALNCLSNEFKGILANQK